MEASATFDVTIDVTAEAVTVGVLGDLDCASSARLRQVLDGVADDPRQLIVDLRGTEFVDCAGIGVLAPAYDRRRQLGRDLVLEAPSRAARRVLELTGLSERIPTTGDQACGSVAESR